MLRGLIERVSRNRIVKRHLPDTFGRRPLFVSPDARLHYLKKSFDQDLLEVVQAHVSKDSVVWDIGSNCGVFGLAAAALATSGKVLAVEADIWLASMIRDTCQLPANADLQMDVLPAAVANQIGISRFDIAARGRASNSLSDVRGRDEAGGVRQTVLVPTLTLDHLLNSFNAPHFMKIDVEGAEVLVLEGAKKLLSEFAPTIYIEVNQETGPVVASILEENGYSYTSRTGTPLSKEQLSESGLVDILAKKS